MSVSGLARVRRAVDVRANAKISALAWGPYGSGKSTLLMTAPKPFVTDFENRAEEHSDKYEFDFVHPKNLEEAKQLFRDLGALNPSPYETIGGDSFSVPYNAFVHRFTRTLKNNENKEYVTTDWIATNRVMSEFMEHFFSIENHNLVAIAQQAVQYEANGKDYRRNGVKAVGDMARWVYRCGYILHYTARGSITIDKSMSPHIPEMTQLYGDMDWSRLKRLISGEEAADFVRPAAHARANTAPKARAAAQSAPAPKATPAATPAAQNEPATAAPAPADEMESVFVNIDSAQHRKIVALAARAGVTNEKLFAEITALTKGSNIPLLPEHADALEDLLKSLPPYTQAKGG